MGEDDFFDASWVEKVTLPVRRVGSGWQLYYGGDIPAREGALGDLTLNAHDIVDEQFMDRMTQELQVKVLDEGTELLVALIDRDTEGQLVGFPEERPRGVPMGTTRFERIRLGPAERDAGVDADAEGPLPGGLWLKVKGLQRCELVSGSILLPEGLGVAAAASLNHAFTLLSARYETHRRSHTGSVYGRVFYQEANGRWFPIDDLRRGVLAMAERPLLKRTWEAVDHALGWRPSVPPRVIKR